MVEDDAAGVEHLGVHQLQGEVPGEVVEHPGAGGDDCRVHGDQVLVDQSGRAGQGPEGGRSAGEDDVRAVLLLELGELAGEVAAEDDPAVGRLHGVGEHDLGHAVLQLGEVGERRGDLGGVGG